ncbi:hypothetical protein JHK85_043277 [Glycine max]|nr:hypothetical protein JHK85_043277 [Glycine max]
MNMRLWSGAWGGATVRQRVGLCSQDDMRRGQLANCVVVHHTFSSSLGLPSPKPHQFSISNLTDFLSLLTHFSSHTSTLPFASTSKWARPRPKPLLKTLSVLDHVLISVVAGGLAGAFTYVYLLPLDALKTKMQTKGATQIYKNTLDAIVKTFPSEGILGFYSGVFTVIVGSTTLPHVTRSLKRTRIATPRLGKLQRLHIIAIVSSTLTFWTFATLSNSLPLAALPSVHVGTTTIVSSIATFGTFLRSLQDTLATTPKIP